MVVHAALGRGDVLQLAEATCAGGTGEGDVTRAFRCDGSGGKSSCSCA